MNKLLDAIRRLRARRAARLLGAIGIAGAVAACAPGTIPSVITEPAQVQAACTLITLAVPFAEMFRTKLSVKEQAILDSAALALKDCAAGNATTAILDVATAIENMLASRGTTRAMLMRRAGPR